MIGPIFSFETSFLFIALTACAFLAVFQLFQNLFNKNGRPGFAALSLLFLLSFLFPFLTAFFQDDHFIFRALEQAGMAAQYFAAFGIYAFFSGIALAQGSKKGVTDTAGMKAAVLILTAGVIAFTDLAVSGRLSYQKLVDGTVFYVTDIAYLAPVHLAVPFLAVTAGIVRFLRTGPGRSSLKSPLFDLSLLFLTGGAALQFLSLSGILNLYIFRYAFFLGMTAAYFAWAAALFQNASMPAVSRDEQEAGERAVRESSLAQASFLNGQTEKTMAVLGEVLDAAESMSKVLMENETLFNSFFALVQDSSDNQQMLMGSLGQREGIISGLQNETGNQMLLVPLLLNRWQSFYNEVKGITGSSSETAQFIDKLISSADNGKVLIQEHLKATNEIRLSTDKVRFIVALINDISDQTNILSINAAIEAFHAGEQGRGFSIIAEEIRQVASTTLQESNAISECIQRILENSKAEENLVKENEMIFNDFSKSMERLFVYILNVIEVTKELRTKMDKLLGELRLLDSGVQPVLQQEQFLVSVFQKEAREIHQYIDVAKSFSDDYFRISSLFATLAAVREKQKTAVLSAGELRSRWEAWEHNWKAGA